MSETTTPTQPNIFRANSAQHVGDLQPTVDVVDYVKEYAREKPEVVALWCLDIGFILGWKLKPW